MWLESHQALRDHPKVIRLAAALRIHRAQAIGHLHCLWWWALDYAQQGDLSRFGADEISAGSLWPGKSEDFLSAIKSCGWMDEDGTIHDWDEYAGRLIQKREADKNRKREERNSSNGCPKDIQGMAQVHTEHNSTVHTKPTKPKKPAGAGSPVEGVNGNGHATRKVPDTAHHQLLAIFKEKWEKKYGSVYHFAAKDTASVKTILAANKDDLKLAGEMIDRYLSCADRWYVEQRHPLATLRSQINRFTAGVSANRVKREECYGEM